MTSLASIGSVSRHTALSALILLAPPLLSVAAHAQEWTVTNLHPAGASLSEAHGVSGGQQVGIALVGSNWRAGLWGGTAASWVDLNPAGAVDAKLFGVSGGRQVGNAGFLAGGEYSLNAGLWSGSAASWVNLHPAGAADSFARGISGDQQVGYVVLVAGELPRASLWSGSAASWVNLHPAGASLSEAHGVSGGQQVGIVWVGDQHASLWSGSAASWVDLNPAGSSESVTYGVSGGQQVGRVSVGVGGTHRASLWSGTAASWVDLSPAGATYSVANGIFGGQQVGNAVVGGTRRASLWSGTAASWVDLHAFLPAGEFSGSTAESIWNDGFFTYVAGYGSPTSGGESHQALLWQAVRCADQDGDGLCDDWETDGIPYTDAAGVPRRYILDADGDGVFDANPLRKDLFVEVDAMQGRAPSQAALDRVIASFNTAPVPAPPGVPGGLPGVTLHVVVDEQDLVLRSYPNNFVEFQQDKTVHFGTPLERADDPNWPMVKEAKAKAYRYCIFAHSHDGGTSSGLADLPGDDFMVTLGLWVPPGGTQQQQAGTFMHELGHTLGLEHGGDQVDTNYKPNYFSTMSYMWQSPKPWMLSGTGPGYWESYFPNYSDRQLPDLNENSLNEVIGIQGHIPTVWIPYSIPAGTVNCDSGTMCVAAPSDACTRYARFSGPVDWNNDCNANSPATGPLDINNIANSGGPSPGDNLTGFNDWPHLLYNFKGQPDSAEGAVPTDSPVEIDFETDLYLNSLPPPPRVADLNCDGVLNGFDINPFMLALIDPAGYAIAFPNCDIMRADISGDGVINGLDIDPFVALLIGG